MRPPSLLSLTGPLTRPRFGIIVVRDNLSVEMVRPGVAPLSTRESTELTTSDHHASEVREPSNDD